MKGKILCPAGCQNPVGRITKAKEILKNPRPAGRQRPFKCIFSGKKKGRAQRAGSPVPFALCTEKPEQGQSAAYLEQVSTTVPKSAILRFCPSRETCWGVPSPNPAMRLAPQKYFRNGYPKIFNVPPVFCPKNVRCKVKGGLQTMPKKYNTPHRSRVVKTRLSEDEYADFTARLAPYGISQSEFLRQAIRRTAIRPIIHVSAVNDEESRGQRPGL